MATYLRFFALLYLFFGLAFSRAAFNSTDSRLYNYQPATRDDTRGPCPGLNSLANHGFLPRNGRVISPVQLATAAFDGLGTTPDIIAAGLALSFSLAALTTQTFHFDLDQLGTHGGFKEHDCSLSREDTALGNNAVFNSTLWNIALAEMKNSHVTSFDMGRARAARVKDQLARNPHSDYSLDTVLTSSLESGMVMAVFGTSGAANRDWIRSFFEHERLPTHLGWTPRPYANNAPTAVALGLVTLLAAPELFPRIGISSIASLLASKVTDTATRTVDKNSDPYLQGIVADLNQMFEAPQGHSFLQSFRDELGNTGLDTTSLDGLMQSRGSYTS